MSNQHKTDNELAAMSNSDAPIMHDDNRIFPLPEHAQRIQFEGCDCVVMSPESYEECFNMGCKFEREVARMREREKLCETTDKAEKLALIRALQEIRDEVGLLGDGVSPRQIVDAVRQIRPTLERELSAAKKELEQVKKNESAYAKIMCDKLAASESSNRELREAALWLAKSCRDRLPEGHLQKIDEEIHKVEALANERIT